MTHKNYTKDENYMLAIYDAAQATGDPESPVNKYSAGKDAGLNPKAVDAISKLLVQANFIKKSGELDVYLTPHGLKLVNNLRLQ